MTTDRRRSDLPIKIITPSFWLASGFCVGVLAVAYLAVARRAWQWGLHGAAYFGVAMAAGIVTAHALQWHRDRQRQRRERARVVADRLLGGPPAAFGQAMVQKPRTLWDALYERLMPHAYHPVDCNEKRTFVRLDIHVQLSWDDRLRLLLCGQMRVLSTVYTDVEVKQCTALTNVEVHPFTVKE